MADTRKSGGDTDDLPDVERVDEVGPVQEGGGAVGTDAERGATESVVESDIEPGPDSGGDPGPAVGAAPQASAGSGPAHLWQGLAAGHRRLALL